MVPPQIMILTMKHSRFLLALLFFPVLFCHTAAAGNPPFKGGERISYKIHYKWGFINADIATLNVSLSEETYNGTPCFRLQTSGGTSDFIKNLVKVNYSYDSRFAAGTLEPLLFKREQTEGDYWAKNLYTWSDGGRTLNAHVDKSTRGPRDTVMKADRPIYDVITVLYALRAADLDAVKKGGKLQFVIALDRNMDDVYVTYETTELKKSREMGELQADKFCLKIVPRKGNENLSKESVVAISNSDDDKLSPVYLWLSGDDSHRLLFFSTQLAVGSINGRIIKAE